MEPINCNILDQVPGEADQPTEAPMTEIDLNEKKPEEDPAKTEAKVEDEKPEVTKTEPESEAPKAETEADDSEAKVVADEAEKEKKVKKPNKTKDRILSSFR